MEVQLFWYSLETAWLRRPSLGNAPWLFRNRPRRSTPSPCRLWSSAWSAQTPTSLKRIAEI